MDLTYDARGNEKSIGKSVVERIFTRLRNRKCEDWVPGLDLSSMASCYENERNLAAVAQWSWSLLFSHKGSRCAELVRTLHAHISRLLHCKKKRKYTLVSVFKPYRKLRKKYNFCYKILCYPLNSPGCLTDQFFFKLKYELFLIFNYYKATRNIRITRRISHFLFWKICLWFKYMLFKQYIFAT